ncbi:unnamed protein product [Lymnaea stagnalis]|uniref:Fucolectin tachylectin-4 pentraxin-1 domain-containing protein n=1 Tax=Lymnaea stagnalis TaxID=6523 RepID=A0AAV2HJK1_LYMST
MNPIGLKWQALILMTSSVGIIYCQEACPQSWFGPQCQYRCHCKDMKCNPKGECIDTHCERGWFEYLCQYANLLALPNTAIATDPIQSNSGWLNDNDDDSCNGDPGLMSVTVTFGEPQVFTWLQLTMTDGGKVSAINVHFKAGNATPAVDCDSRVNFALTNSRFEIRCDLQDSFTTLILSGESVHHLCTLDVNGGRNVALKQETKQAGDLNKDFPTTSDLAVDGNTSSVLSDGTCAHTSQSQDPLPSWTLKYKNDFLITRILLYNMQDNGDRLQQFSIDGYDADNNPIFSHVDQREQTLEVYDVVNTHWATRIRSFVVTVWHTKDALALCEVETFGECPAGTADLDCKSCKDNCSVGTCFRDGSCKVGCDGMANPPLCVQDCPSGKWGSNCSENCSTNCYNQSCHSETGACSKGCDGYSDPPLCSLPCPSTTWGRNCTRKCSENCSKSSCNKQSGQCDKECSADSNSPDCTTESVPECNRHRWGPKCDKFCGQNCYMALCNLESGICDQGCNAFSNPPDCTIECLPGKWGKDCKYPCTVHCSDESCDRISGDCHTGCNGYDDFPYCITKCLPGKWGVNCTNDCSHCSDNVCDNMNGKCTPAVQANCTKGFYGANCTLLCSLHCKDRICDRFNGSCAHCVPGYNGTLCDNAILEEEGYTLLDKILFLFLGLALGCMLLALILIVLCLCRKTRRKRPMSITRR